MANRFQVVGPPGCGKTTYLKRQVERAAATLGPQEVMVCSLTKAAAAEVKGRGVPIPQDRVGTLHSFAFRALGGPVVAESKLKEWNDAHPRFRLSSSMGVSSPEDDTQDDRGGGDEPGDELYEEMNVCRHERKDARLWRPTVAEFHKAWSAWQHETGYVDFTGLIETALEQTSYAPGRPLALFVDEAQDMSRLEVDLVRSWGESCSTVIAVGDPAQALYTWRGAEPDAFADVGEAERRIVLGQSWRVPREPHAFAVRWGSSLLEGVEYLPTERQGSVEEIDESLRRPEGIAELAAQHLADPSSGRLMIQALCSYMLRPLIKALREAAIPFHNPQRSRRGDWNPLGARSGTSTVNRLLAYLTDDQTPETVALWLPMLQSKGVLAKGAKERVKEGVPSDPHEIMALFASEDVAARAFSADAAWLQAHAVSEYQDRLKYPIAVARARGPETLQAEPRVLVGTVHSFKGGEAEHVLVCPDLSPASYAEWVDDGPSVRRAFYVALTRTLDRLSIMQPSSKRCVDLAA
jgi:DNA helicase-2/ATP-dependent DNA helicase PcrA